MTSSELKFVAPYTRLRIEHAHIKFLSSHPGLWAPTGNQISNFQSDVTSVSMTSPVKISSDRITKHLTSKNFMGGGGSQKIYKTCQKEMSIIWISSQGTKQSIMQLPHTSQVEYPFLLSHHSN